jgi:hypothetical protein
MFDCPHGIHGNVPCYLLRQRHVAGFWVQVCILKQGGNFYIGYMMWIVKGEIRQAVIQKRAWKHSCCVGSQVGRRKIPLYHVRKRAYLPEAPSAWAQCIFSPSNNRVTILFIRNRKITAGCGFLKCITWPANNCTWRHTIICPIYKYKST